MIITKNSKGKRNGWLLPIFNINDKFVDEAQHPKQVYLTVISPKGVKGPHLHLKRWGLFTCIKGNAKIIIRTENGYDEYFSGEDYNFATIQVPAGTPAALKNLGNSEAYIINMPSPAWSIDDQDEHPVSFDDYSFD